MSSPYMMVLDAESKKRSSLTGCLKRATASEAWKRYKIKEVSAPDQAETFAEENEVPVVFIGDGVDETDTFRMIRKVREKKRRTNFIFVTDRQDYIVHALQMNLRLSGCITQEPSCENVTEQLENLWFPIE